MPQIAKKMQTNNSANKKQTIVGYLHTVVWEQEEFERMYAQSTNIAAICENVRPKSWQ